MQKTKFGITKGQCIFLQISEDTLPTSCAHKFTTNAYIIQAKDAAKMLQNTEYRQAPLCQSQIPYYCRDFMFICSTLGHITPSLLHIIQYSGNQLLNLPSFFQVSAPHCPGEFTTWLHASNSTKRQTTLYLQVKVLLLSEHLSPSCYPIKKCLKCTLLDSSSSSCRVNQAPLHL